MEAAGESKSKSKSKILVIGGTGRIGKHIVIASIKAGHPTFILVRPTTAALHPAKAELISTYKSNGATVLYGDVHDYESLVTAIEQVDVVISAMGHQVNEELAAQFKIVEAIQAAGNIKRFIPSEFGIDAERVKLVEPAKSLLASKVLLRQAIREMGIPHTFVCSFLLQAFFLPRLGQAEATSPPTHTVSILGDGNTKAIFVNREDVAEYTIRSVDDPLTLNKILHVRPPANFFTLNELVSLWEKKIGKTLEKIYVPEEELLKNIQDSSFPLNFQLAIAHSVFMKGELTNFEIDPAVGVEACDLFPDVKYVTVEDFLTNLAKDMH